MKKRNKQENVWFSQHKDEKMNVDLDFKCLKFHLNFIRKTTTTGSVPLKRVNKSINRSMNLENPRHVMCTFRWNHQVVCLSFSRFSIFSCINLYFIVYFKIQRRIDFESEYLRRQNRTPSWLLSTNGLIQIVMRLVGLANEKPRMCYYTCDHMIFIKWVISLNNMTMASRFTIYYAK